MAGKQCSFNDCLLANIWFRHFRDLLVAVPANVFDPQSGPSKVLFRASAIPVPKEPEPERAPTAP